MMSLSDRSLMMKGSKEEPEICLGKSMYRKVHIVVVGLTLKIPFHVFNNLNMDAY